MNTEIHKNPFAWRRWLVGGFAFVVMVLALVWAFSLAGPVSQAMEERQQEGLLSVANAARVAIETSEKPADEVIDAIASNDQLRMTLVLTEGDVIAESEQSSAALTNHASRPEVIQAIAEGIGSDRRVSETDGIEYLYVAVLCEYNNEPCVLRVSMAATLADEEIAHMRWTGFALLAAAVLLAIGVAWVSFGRVSEPVGRLEQVRTDFVANASHELKTPIAGIRLLAESTRRACEQQDLEAIESFSLRLDKESARLQELVGDLMALSRLEGEQPIEQEADVAAIVLEECEKRRERAEKRGLAFELALPEGPLMVSSSPFNVRLVVSNLLDNAFAYTDAGAVRVSLTHEGPNAVLEVADSGIGIPEESQDRIFERFYRVDVARSRDAGGTGLGLSLVRHAVERDGGTIALHSQEGIGSNFIVMLPCSR